MKIIITLIKYSLKWYIETLFFWFTSTSEIQSIHSVTSNINSLAILISALFHSDYQSQAAKRDIHDIWQDIRDVQYSLTHVVGIPFAIRA
jgi:hypothetical protein